MKRLLPVHFSRSSAHLRPQVLTNGGDVKKTNENTIYYSKIVTFLATRNTDSSNNNELYSHDHRVHTLLQKLFLGIKITS